MNGKWQDGCPGGGRPVLPVAGNPAITALSGFFPAGFLSREIRDGNLTVGDALTFLSGKNLTATLWYSTAGFGALVPDGLQLDFTADWAELGLIPWSDSLYAMVESSWPPAGDAFRIESWTVSYEGGAFTVNLRFTGDVSASLSAGDLAIRLNGSPVDPALISFTYDPAKRSGTWKLPAAASDQLQVELPSSQVADQQGRPLDGDGDGNPGGTFRLDQPVPLETASPVPPIQ